MTTTTDIPNHHRHHPGFSGGFGLLAALSMTCGRGGDARLAAELTGVVAGDRVVDIGCGPGAAMRHAASLGATVIGVDPARVMRRTASLLTRSRRVTILEGTAEHLPLPSSSATVIWSIATVHHWADVEAGLAEVQRVLEPKGRFLAIERLTPRGAKGHASHGWNEAQSDALADACRTAGFVNAQVTHHDVRRGRLLAVRADRS